MEFTRAVVSETLRLYPSAWAISREAIADVVLDGTTIRKGSVLVISQWVMHRDPRFFDAPDEFRPERCLDGLAARLPRFGYFPFGGGQRQCIGNEFALMEGVLILATMARRVRFHLLPGQSIKPEPAVTLRPNAPVLARVEQRSRSRGRASDIRNQPESVTRRVRDALIRCALPWSPEV